MLVTRTLYGVSFVQRSNYNGNDQHLAGISNMASREGVLWTMMRILIGVSLNDGGTQCPLQQMMQQLKMTIKVTIVSLWNVLCPRRRLLLSTIWNLRTSLLQSFWPAAKTILVNGNSQRILVQSENCNGDDVRFCRQWVWNPTTSPQLHSLQSKTNQVSNYFQRQPMLVWFFFI